MGRHRPLWLCSARYGLCVQWNSAAPVMGLSETWIDIGCYGFPCLLWALRAGKLCSACYGQELVIRVWALCGLSCPGLIMLFLGRVLTCCSFTELCHFVAIAHPLAQEFTFPPELSVNMFRDPELRQLAQALPYILVHNRVVSTVSTYLGAYKSWKAWALRHNASVLPADSVTFAVYVVSLIQEVRSMSAVNTAVYGVSYVHKKSALKSVNTWLLSSSWMLPKESLPGHQLT